MSGIINGTPAPASAPDGVPPKGGETELSNPILQQCEDKIESGLTVQNKQNYDKVLVAGMHAALAGGPDGILASLRNSRDPVADAAKGAIGLMLILRKEARGVMPMKAAVPAAMTLMLKALDFIGRSKLAPVGEAELVRATHIFADTVFAKFGITKQGLADVGQKIQGLMADPQSRQALDLKAGLVRHPMAVMPTPLPKS